MSNEHNEHAVPVEQALERLTVSDEGSVHTFVQGGPALIGADWILEDVHAAIREHGVEEAGPLMRAMGHTLATLREDGRPIFWEARSE